MDLLLIDDHPLFREGLKFLLRSLDSELTVDEAGDCDQALGIGQQRLYDLVLLDMKLPGLNGLDALEAVRKRFPFAALVVVSGDSSPRLVREAIDRGAMGFIPKSSTPEVLVHALRQVLGNKVYLPEDALTALPVAQTPAAADDAMKSLPELTPRQTDVLRCVIQGKSNQTVASELGVSRDTVKSHLAAVMRALEARNRTELVYIVAKRGLRLV
jgi:DNA-binding NarL/FixJ family response regulator